MATCRAKQGSASWSCTQRNSAVRMAGATRPGPDIMCRTSWERLLDHMPCDVTVTPSHEVHLPDVVVCAWLLPAVLPHSQRWRHQLQAKHSRQPLEACDKVADVAAVEACSGLCSCRKQLAVGHLLVAAAADCGPDGAVIGCADDLQSSGASETCLKDGGMASPGGGEGRGRHVAWPAQPAISARMSRVNQGQWCL